jgi:hypothetical protein
LQSNLRNRYGVVLSNDVEQWTKKIVTDFLKCFQIYLMIHTRKYNFSNGDNIRGVFKLTKDDQYRDLTITQDGNLKMLTISQSAFVYANPQIVTIRRH